MSAESKIIDQLIEKHQDFPDSFKKKLGDVLKDMYDNGKTPLEATQIDKDIIEAIYSMVFYYYQAGQNDPALKLSEILFALDPTDKRFSFSLAAAHQQLGNYKSAFNYFFINSQVDEDSPVPFFHMTDCFLNMNEPVGALMMLEIMLEKAQSDPVKYSQLINKGRLQYEELLKTTGIELTGSRNMTLMEQIKNPPKKKVRSNGDEKTS